MQVLGIESALLSSIIDGRASFIGTLGEQQNLKIHEGDKVSLREDTYEGDAIIGSHPDKASIEIVQVLYFESFDEMLAAVGFKNVIPNAEGIDEALAFYTNIYSLEDEFEYGVIAFEFRLIDHQ